MSADLRNLLSKRGLRITPQRLVIYEALCEMGNHPTAEALINEVQRRLPAVSPATIYNTLELLGEMGLAVSLTTPSGTRCFDGDVVPHAHAICQECGKIEDIAMPWRDDLVAEPLKNVGFNLKQQRHEFLGKCAVCSGQQEAAI